jgi:hypothetical protein
LRQTFVATTASIAAIFGRIRRIPAGFRMPADAVLS